VQNGGGPLFRLPCCGVVRGLETNRFSFGHSADGQRSPPAVKPLQIVARIVGIGEARKFERHVADDEAMVACDPLLACVDDVHPEQLAVVIIGEGKVLGHAPNLAGWR
jgi:hypothetical protein